MKKRQRKKNEKKLVLLKKEEKLKSFKVHQQIVLQPNPSQNEEDIPLKPRRRNSIFRL